MTALTLHDTTPGYTCGAHVYDVMDGAQRVAGITAEPDLAPLILAASAPMIDAAGDHYIKVEVCE